MGLVLLTLIDGLRPDAIRLADCPSLQALLQRSSYSLAACSVMPSITLPCHMSIFHSVPPTRHGVTTNDWAPMARPLPGLVEQARAGGHRCAFFYNWEPLRNVSQPGNLEISFFHEGAELRDGDHVIVWQAARHLAKDPPGFAFVYLGTVDTAGHRHGWMSDGYLDQISHVDGALGMLLDALPSDTTILLQSDHGGHDRSHGTELAEDMTIPWLLSGPGIEQNCALEGDVSLLDTAPTLAALLGVNSHREWEGRSLLT